MFSTLFFLGGGYPNLHAHDYGPALSHKHQRIVGLVDHVGGRGRGRCSFDSRTIHLLIQTPIHRSHAASMNFCSDGRCSILTSSRASITSFFMFARYLSIYRLASHIFYLFLSRAPQRPNTSCLMHHLTMSIASRWVMAGWRVGILVVTSPSSPTTVLDTRSAQADSVLKITYDSCDPASCGGGEGQA